MALDNSRPFQAMAERIEHNDARDFAGAFVIMPPDGQPIEYLALNPKQDAAAFWGAVQAHVQRVMAEMEEKQRNPFSR